jgi:hypothetical protein
MVASGWTFSVDRANIVDRGRGLTGITIVRESESDPISVSSRRMADAACT